MLNELWNAIEENACLNMQYHDHFQPCQKTSLIVLYLGKGRAIEGIEFLGAEDAVKINKWVPNNFKSFPVINFDGFFQKDNTKNFSVLMQKLTDRQVLSDADAIEKVSELIRQAQRTLSLVHEGKKLRDVFKRSFVEATNDIREIIDSADATVDNLKWKAVNELLNRMRAYDDAETIENSLVELLKQQIVSDRNKTITLLDFLFSKTKRQVLFDLPSREGYLSVKSQLVQNYLNQQLLLLKSQQDQVVCGKDAFGDMLTQQDREELMPSVRVPVIGDVILRSLNKEIPAQNRYRMTGSESFPVGANSRDKLKAALSNITAQENRGKTWQNISNSQYDKAILCAYTPGNIKKSIDISLVQCLLESSEQTMTVTNDIAKVGNEQVLSALQAMVVKEPNLKVFTFTLVKVDNARKKVVWPMHTSATNLLNAARLWQEQGKNIPRLISVKVTGSTNPVVLGNCIPLPGDVAWLLNCSWRKNEKKEEQVHVYNYIFGEGIKFFLSTGSVRARASRKMLSTILRYNSNALIAYGARNIRGEALTVNLNEKLDLEMWLQKIPTMVAIFLATLDRKVEIYVEDFAYKLGRFLALADLLHREYIRRDKKDASLPPALLGNQYLLRVSRFPAKGISELGERIRIYTGWAEKEGNGLARWAVAEMGRMFPQKPIIPINFSDVENAELIMGYLSRSEKQDK